MSKGIKKAFKGVAKAASLGAVGSGGWGSKAVGALSGGLVGDSSVYGSSGGLAGVLGGGQAGLSDLAKTQMQIANQQAQQAATEAQYQAQAAALATQAENDRAAAQAAAAALPTTDTTQVDVTTADSGDAASRRKRFNSTSIGASSTPAGPAIRI